MTCDRGPNVVPAPTVIKSASDGTSSALDSSHFHFQGYEVQSRGFPGNAGMGILLRPLPSPGGEAWHFHACSVFLSISRGRPRWTVHKCLHFRCPAKSEAARRMEGRGPGTGRFSWFQGAGSGGCALFPMSIFRNRKHHVSWSRDPHPSSTRWTISRCPRSGESRGATLPPKLMP